MTFKTIIYSNKNIFKINTIISDKFSLFIHFVSSTPYPKVNLKKLAKVKYNAFYINKNSFLKLLTIYGLIFC